MKEFRIGFQNALSERFTLFCTTSPSQGRKWQFLSGQFTGQTAFNEDTMLKKVVLTVQEDTMVKLKKSVYLGSVKDIHVYMFIGDLVGFDETKFTHALPWDLDELDTLELEEGTRQVLESGLLNQLVDPETMAIN